MRISLEYVLVETIPAICLQSEIRFHNEGSVGDSHLLEFQVPVVTHRLTWPLVMHLSEFIDHIPLTHLLLFSYSGNIPN